MSVLVPIYKTAGSLVSPGGAGGRLTILTYHRVLPEADPLLPPEQIDARHFDDHMSAVRSCFTVLPLEEAIDRLYAGTLPARALSITFDDGYEDNYAVALPILQRHGLSATFFVCSGYLDDGMMFNDCITEAVRHAQGSPIDLSWLGLGLQPATSVTDKLALSTRLVKAVKYLPFDERANACDRIWHQACGSIKRPQLMMTRDQVRALSRAGMSIGAHTHTHPILSKVSIDTARADIQDNIETLHNILDKRPKVFAYPNGYPNADYDLRHVQLVKELGFSAAVSAAWGIASQDGDRFQMPRFAPWNDASHRFILHLMKNAVVGRKPRTATARDVS